jgi:hypothetical protein
LKDLSVDGRILKFIFKEEVGGVNWIVVAQDRDRRRDLANVVINFPVP